MTPELEKQFFDTFGIEPCFRNWQQYNFGRVKDGLKLFPERQKLADEGYIKITCKKLNPTEFSDCVYWEEYHYPQISDKRYLELICVLNKNTSIMDRLYKNEMNIECLKNTVLKDLIRVRKLYDIKHQVQAIFEEER